MSISKLLISLGFILSCSYTFAKSADVNKELSEIRNFAVTSYNNKNIDALMSTWHEDGVFIGYIGQEPEIVSGAHKVREFYMTEFARPHFSKISMKSTTTNIVNDVYIDSGTISFIEPNGSIGLTGCYVIASVKVGDSFKVINEFSYPFCMPSKQEH